MTSQNDEVMAALVPWFRRRLISKDETKRIVKEIQPREQTLIRTVWSGRSRRIVVKTAETENVSRKLDPPVSPDQFDPWGPESLDLAEKTRQLTECEVCGGEKWVDCPTCNASGYVRCFNCSGSGRVWSSRSKRTINCPECRGKGQRKCNCRNGTVKCPDCGGKGKVERWLEVNEEFFNRPTELSLGVEKLSLPWIKPGLSGADDDARYTAATSSASWSGPTPNVAPPELAPWFKRQELKAKIDSARDRLIKVSIEVFRRPVWEVHYSMLGRTGCLTVVGDKHHVVPQPGASTPIWFRQILLGIIAIVVFIVGQKMHSNYVAQYPEYFSRTVNAALLSAGAWLLPFFLWPLIGYLLVQSWRLWRWLSFGIPAAACLLTITIASNTGYPTIEEANQLFKSGNLVSALETAQAMIQMDRDKVSAQKLSDEILIQSASRETDWDTLLSYLNKRYYAPENRQTVEKQVVSTALVVSDKLFQEGKYQIAESVLSSIPERLQTDAVKKQRVRIHIPGLFTLIESTDTASIEKETALLKALGATPAELIPTQNSADALAQSRMSVIMAEADDRSLGTDQQLSRYLEMKRLAEFAAVAGSGNAALPISKEQIETKVGQLSTKLAKAQAVEEERLAREKKKEEQKLLRQQQREERQRQQEATRERRRSNGGGRAECCDGTLSPSCGCGGGRGCCSHHGGVCGCS